MKTTELMKRAIEKQLSILRTAREAMQAGITDELPPLTQNELFLLRVIDAKEREIQMNNELIEIVKVVTEIEMKRKQSEEKEKEERDSELKAGQYEKLKSEFDFAYSLMSDNQKREWAKKVHIVKPSFIKVVEE